MLDNKILCKFWKKKKKSSGNTQSCTIDSKTIYTDESIAVLRNLKKIYIKLLSQTDSDISNPITNPLIKNIYIYIYLETNTYINRLQELLTLKEMSLKLN